MKKLFLLVSVVLTTSLVAQDVEPVNFVANLSEVFVLNVVSGRDQIATFATASDYDNGVDEISGIAPGFTDITMEAMTNWSLDIRGEDFDDGGGQLIPINNLGVWVDETPATPIHEIGDEVACTNIDPTTSMGITLLDQTLLNVGINPEGNAGNSLENAFTLHWRMGTTDGTMNTETMFTQISNGDFGPGAYSSVITLTLNPE